MANVSEPERCERNLVMTERKEDWSKYLGYVYGYSRWSDMGKELSVEYRHTAGGGQVQVA